MNTHASCPVCGQPLPPAAPEGLCPRCLLSGALSHTAPAPRPSPPPLDAVRAAFPHLEIEELVGQGGMGSVFRARQPALDRRVALKILAPELTGEPRFADRFRQEAQALARLSHPHIVTIHDHGRAAGFYYLLMEFVDGVSLRQALQAGRLAPAQALAIVPPVCEALQYAHDHGVVHRDIKPENLLLDKDGRVKIADFGIARLLRAPGAAAENPPPRTERATSAPVEGTRFAGTPPYMAPEQAANPSAVDHRADIYALGVVLYEMLTGEPPGKLLQPPSARVSVDVRLDEIVLRALATRPELRFANATEFKTRVEVVAADSAPATARADDPPRALRKPALGLLATAGLHLFIAQALLFFALPAIAREGGDHGGYAAIGAMGALSLVSAAVIAAGALAMLRARRHALAVRASILAVVAGPAALVGAPFGLWALRILHRAGIREAFARPAAVPPTPASTSPLLHFRSKLAARVFACSGLGGLGALGLIPRLEALAGLFGFFGLAGVGLLIEFLQRKQERLAHDSPDEIAALAAGWRRVLYLAAGAGVVGSALAGGLAAHSPLVRASLIVWSTAGLALIAALAFATRRPPEKERRALRTVARIGLVHAVGVLALGLGPLVAPPATPLRPNAAAKTLPLLTQKATLDLTPEGVVRTRVEIEAVNASDRPLRSARFHNSDFVHVERIHDGKGRPLAYQARPEADNRIAYQLEFREPVAPGETYSYASEGFETGLIKAVDASGVFEYAMKHWPGYPGVTRRVELHRLPRGARLVEHHPDDLAVATIDDRVELRLDRRVPPGGHVEVRYRYRLPGGEGHDRVIVEDLALRLVVAIREEDDDALRALAGERIPGWPDALPGFAVELRERYRQGTGDTAFDLRPVETLVDGDLAAVRCTGPAGLGESCLVLFFFRDSAGWANHSLRASTKSTPLARLLGALRGTPPER